MKVILRSDLAQLGKRGDIVDVADGHARNYLLPKGLAFAASEGAIQQAARMRQSRDQRDALARDSARTVASTLVPKVVTVTAKAGPGGKLFGSVTASDVAEAVLEQTGIEIDRHDITAEGIKSLGQHQVTASLHRDVSFPISIDVQPA